MYIIPCNNTILEEYCMQEKHCILIIQWNLSIAVTIGAKFLAVIDRWLL